jgi:RecJ-like exonuclease
MTVDPEQPCFKRCHVCHGKGKRMVITRMTFGEDDSEMDAEEIICDTCEGEGKIYIVPASKAPKHENQK